MHLTLCMITKGDSELSSLKTAVGSVIDHVDEVCITTNHDHVETEKWCASNPKIKHSHMPWNDDFGTQRNFNFSQASDETDYIIWMDSDDVIVNPHLLRDIAKISKQRGYDNVFFSYWYGALFDGEPSIETFVEAELVQSRERLIRPGSIIWKKRIHETPVPLDPDAFKYSRVPHSKEYPIAWLHLGAARDTSVEVAHARTERNKRLLELELADERASNDVDARTLLYLMKIYADDENVETLKECISMGQEYMEKSGWDEERAICCQLMASCYGKLDMHERAKSLLHDAIEQYPYSPLLYLHLARACFNLKDFRAMKHWMDFAMSMDTKAGGASMSNILELKVLSAELMLNFYLYGERDMRKAHDAARLLNRLNPTQQNEFNEQYLFNQAELDKASEAAHKYIKYLEEIQTETLISKFINTMPKEMQQLPFAIHYKNKYTPPRRWGATEICYYASFGKPHFEKWDGNSLSKGIGGSETAVIRLAEEWTKLGYRVTVYCDPLEEVVINDVLYKPYYQFNHRDKFNIFIQWRSSHLASKISAKKFLVDLHDVFHESSHIDKLDQIDKLMVKSTFHAEYAPSIDSSQIGVISNGI